ncbi:ribose-phosphate pyrophosphokinase [Candidatus Roizmanbacteria bacterium CG_4_10_14_0_2_um_filter_36_35]|uniref:ribose-phosphate diphosphokinase n=4 Tax=Candidatus Roizmaniibacteriota TaxID=1752723 RepID=A0A2M7BWR9_9BACT|nr:MAG: ribose-phosphate pyrophosphokinase [Candidatus Roizmanbacteria bacterium CG11_big_fil_rev_8_21_14_0_20_35_14]PIV11033.1 MAG: ribose-phosphate pyrophosphokinase [Candidatus Roizmanbacteria bacterium CG03_land_8_20_14_0_80_35_26]PIZ67000.1 MAG: ribose-phosphate pyrophosphokinase [Candidatus Roizmanbacteria bacterium CG_4_10_14_0_2_um_filter_36_35]PJC32731.1 MAG: ribose-phosphate pyrophosphokinase [Candidatus Roizmanbacteria bacterium CG_4_9_14_0_2_um_filter_36_12]PJC80389.1 MAG: ribose-ph
MLKLFTGSANPKLSQEVSQLLKLPLSHSEVIHFDNSEVRVCIKEKVKNAICVVVQSTSNPTDTHLMELFFFADALKRNGAKEIIAFIPYFGYARQNREHLPGEAVSTNVVIRFLETIGFNAVYTINLHDEGTEGIFSITFKNLSAFNILGQEVAYYLKNNKNTEEVAIVSPDQGGVDRAQIFAENFFHSNKVDVAVIEKRRNLNVIHQSKALNLYGDVKNKTCIIVDDIITSGGTLVHAAEFCLKRGAKRVLACIVHHDFSPNAKEILAKSPIEKIFMSNSIALKPSQEFSQLKEVSIAPLIAHEIKNLL